jgi:serine/threonine-protein kinase
VLFEMLTGANPFACATITDTLAHVLEREPEWGALPGETPASIRTLVRRCLIKDPDKRLHDIADARIEIDDRDLSVASAFPARRPRSRTWMAATVLGAAAVAAFVTAAVLGHRTPQPAIEPIEFTIAPPEGATFPPRYGGFAVAPDGRYLVVTASSEHRSSLWVRPIGTPQYRELAGTDGAFFPFWKPDSLEIGFSSLAFVPARR